jgi:thiosulfate dehydrogenase [quinone] large subunit
VEAGPSPATHFVNKCRIHRRKSDPRSKWLPQIRKMRGVPAPEIFVLYLNPMNTDTDHAPDSLALTYAAWLARLWLGVRALQSGIEKFGGTAKASKDVAIDGKPNDYGLAAETASKEYSFENYHGVPEALYDQFVGEPLIPAFFLKFYDWILGPALLALGLTVLLGIASRTSLFLLGALYVSLTWGLILLNQSSGVAWLAAHVILIVMALQLSRFNKLCLLKKW